MVKISGIAQEWVKLLVLGSTTFDVITKRLSKTGRIKRIRVVEMKQHLSCYLELIFWQFKLLKLVVKFKVTNIDFSPYRTMSNYREIGGYITIMGGRRAFISKG